MKRMTIVMCAVMLVATALFAGCTSQSAPPQDNSVPVTPQYTETPATQSAPSAEITQAATEVPAQTGSLDQDVATANEDAQVDQYNSTQQATTMVPDSADVGTPIP